MVGQVVEERADGEAAPRKVYLGIIDIWQDWSRKKRLERYVPPDWLDDI